MTNRKEEEAEAEAERKMYKVAIAISTASTTLFNVDSGAVAWPQEDEHAERRSRGI